MNPLETLIKKSNNPESILLRYLPDNTVSQIYNKTYYDPDSLDLFLNQKIWCIDKTNGKISYIGKICKILHNSIYINCGNKYIHIYINHYYIFISNSKSKTNDYQYYKALLDMF